MKYRKNKYHWESNLKKGFVEEIKKTSTGFIFKAKDDFLKEENPLATEGVSEKILVLPSAAKALNSLVTAGSTWSLFNNNWKFWEAYIACWDSKNEEGHKFFIDDLAKLEGIVKQSQFQAISLIARITKDSENVVGTEFILLYINNDNFQTDLEKITLIYLNDFPWKDDLNYITSVTFRFDIGSKN